MGKYAVITMDVEDWYQCDYFLGSSKMDEQYHMLDGLYVLADILRRNQVKGTFFLVDDLLEQVKDKLVELDREGCEIGCHGYKHVRPIKLEKEEFRAQITKAKADIEGVLGHEILGYRAPTFGIDDERLQVIRDLGFKYDSSKNGFAQNPRYGHLNISGFQEAADNIYTDGDFCEFEISTQEFLGYKLPLGGGYLRMLPWLFNKHQLRKYADRGKFYVLYIHPFELSQKRVPYVPDAGLKNRIRSTLGRGGGSEKGRPCHPIHEEPRLRIRDLPPTAPDYAAGARRWREMSGKWKPIAYVPEHMDGLLAMSREQYGADNDICNRAFLERQYFENPAGDALIELAADKESGTLAGQYVVKPVRFRAFGRNVRCVLSLNTLTREAYRGQKVFTSLAERVYARAEAGGYAYVYGVPNPNSYPGFLRELAFEDIHHFPLYVRPLELPQMVRERLGNAALAGMSRPFNVLFPCREETDASIVDLTAENSGMMDGFWQQIKDKYPVMGVRDAAYIRHRYINVPHRKYHPYVYIKEGDPVAFAVGRVREVAGFQCGMVADLLFITGYEKEARRLVRRLVWELKQAGASLAGCGMLAHTEEARQIKKCGFFRCPDFVLPQPTPIILRVFDEGLREKGIKDIRNWFFTTGDYDVV